MPEEDDEWMMGENDDRMPEEDDEGMAGEDDDGMTGQDEEGMPENGVNLDEGMKEFLAG